MKIASIIARYLLGLMFTVFGLNGFLNFIHQPPPANIARGGDLQHPCFSPDACASQHRPGAGRICVMDSGFPSVQQEFQGHSGRETCEG